jgi:hypothetical protein
MRPAIATAFTIALLVASGVLLVLTAAFEPGARFVPLSVLVPLLALLAVQLVRDFRAGRAERAAGSAPGGLNDASVTRVEASALGWVLGFGLLLAGLGLLAGPAAFVLLYLRRRSRERWIVALAGGAVTALAYWLILTNALGVDVPGGALRALFMAGSR